MFAFKNNCLLSLVAGLLWLVIASGGVAVAQSVSLPEPAIKGPVAVEEALQARRSHRSFKPQALTLKQFAQMLWAAYGVTDQKHGYYLKTAPSAGGLYPLDVYAVAGPEGVEGLKAGVWRYRPPQHAVELVKAEDVRTKVAQASLSQMWMARAPIVLVITGEYARSTIKYGPRGVIYTHIEAGCVGQNIFLQAEALGLKAGIVGAFNNARVIEVLGLPSSHDPLLIMPLGHPD